ncbi:PadR family transcriptional regulator [Cellulosimicrobium sp. PMB13]|uniref:PadR family transcriptional regulator n=1 Tax=Cellulosimicrobium sp. PMB13 TaxID=3120158 RepID=UPI003F4B2E21
MASTDTVENVQRAVLPTAVLSALQVSPNHGYALVAQLRSAGFTGVQGGTLYPLLRELEHHGLLTSRWDVDGSGPARKVVELTERGAQRLRDDHEAIRTVLAQLDALADRGERA